MFFCCTFAISCWTLNFLQCTGEELVQSISVLCVLLHRYNLKVLCYVFYLFIYLLFIFFHLCFYFYTLYFTLLFLLCQFIFLYGEFGSNDVLLILLTVCHVIPPNGYVRSYCKCVYCFNFFCLGISVLITCFFVFVF